MDRPPITLTIRYRATTLCELIRTYYVDVIPGGMIVRTRWPDVALPPGTSVRLRILLDDGSLVIGGDAVIGWMRGRRTADGREITVLALRFAGLGHSGRRIYSAMIEHGRRVESADLKALRETLLRRAATRRSPFREGARGLST